MKLRSLIVFYLGVCSFQAIACGFGFLKSKERNFLISSSPYNVDNLECKKGIYSWSISNKKYFIFKKKLDVNKHIKNSQYSITHFKLNQKGNYQWRIDNGRFRRKAKKLIKLKRLKKLKKRVPASLAKNSRKTSKKKLKKEKSEKYLLSLSLYSGIANMVSTDTAVGTIEKMASDLGYGVSALWGYLLNEKLNFFVIGSIKNHQFKTSSNRTLSKTSMSHSYLGLGLNIKVNEGMTITPEVGVGEALIISSGGGSALTIDKLSIPAAALSARIRVVKFRKNLSIDFKARAGALLPTEQRGIKTKLGQYYYLGIGPSYKIGRTGMSIDAGYTIRNLQFGDAKQTSKSLGANVGFGWSF